MQVTSLLSCKTGYLSSLFFVEKIFKIPLDMYVKLPYNIIKQYGKIPYIVKGVYNMTNAEKQTIKEFVKEQREIAQKYYEICKVTGDWKDHQIACERLRTAREFALRLGVIA